VCEGRAEPTPGPLPDHLEDLFRASTVEMTRERDVEDVRTLLRDFQDVFAIPGKPLGVGQVDPHRIDTGINAPVKQRTFRMSAEAHKVVQTECTKMLEMGAIRESKSPWSSPVVLVTKKNGDVRFCVDYRCLNALTTKDSYPLPNISDTLGALGGCQHFCTMDLASGFWQIPMAEEDKCKTAFATRDGLYEFNTMPFGLCNAPATFERIMETVLRGLNWIFCLVYIDDIVVGGPTVQETVRRLGLVFERLREAKLKLKPAKCSLFKPSVAFLGHVVNAQGINTDPEKVRAIAERPEPRNLEELWSFLGMARYYRGHIKDYAQMATPLHDLTKKNTPWTWGPVESEGYRSLVVALSGDTILAHPRVNEEGWIVDTDASGYALGAVLSQVQDGKERVIRYASKSLVSGAAAVLYYKKGAVGGDLGAA
jgi:hypothetical protein